MNKLAHSNQKTMDEIESRSSDANNDFIDDEATKFAAYLLIPDQFFKDDLAAVGRVDIDDEIWIDKMCKKYKVSKGLMHYRLKLHYSTNS